VNDFLKSIKQSEFGKNVITLTGGTAIAHTFPFFISPILTRLFTPEDFGVLTLFSSIFGMIVLIISGRYELAIVLPKEKKDAYHLAYLSFFISLIITAVGLFFSIVFDTKIAELLKSESILEWLIYIPIAAFFSGLYNILNYLHLREKAFKKISVAVISSSVSNNVAKLGIGYLMAGPAGLIYGTVLGPIFSSFVFLGKVSNEAIKYAKHITKKGIKSVAKTYKDFPLINSLHALADGVNVNVTILLISAFFGEAILGLYGFTFRILKAPLGIIGSSTGQVFFQRISENYANKKELLPLFKKTTLMLVKICIIPFIILGFSGEYIFAFIFGSEWGDAGIYAQIMAPWMFVNFISSPVSQIPLVFHKQKEFFYLSITATIFSLLGIYIGGKYFDIYYTLVIVTGINMIFQTYYIIWFYKLIKGFDKSLTLKDN